MNSEFNIGDIAHVDNGKRVRGILNFSADDEQYKDFTLKSKQPVEIVNILKSKVVKETGGYVYGVMAEYKGIKYYIESISQNNLVPKKLWLMNEEQTKRIAELMKNQKSEI